MNTVYRYFRILALMVLSTQVVVGMNADMAGRDLYNAVGARDIQAVSNAIAAGVDVNWQNQFGWSPLMEAADFNPSIVIVQALLEAGADPNVQDLEGRTILMKSVIYPESIEVIKALIEAGADVNVQDLEGHTVLLIAKRVIYRLMNLLQILCDTGKLYDQLYAISEDQNAVIAEVESIMQEVQQQAPESEQKQTILQELQGFLDSYSHGLK